MHHHYVREREEVCNFVHKEFFRSLLISAKNIVVNSMSGSQLKLVLVWVEKQRAMHTFPREPW